MAQRAVLITGGAKRIGKALAGFFGSQGYAVALHYNTSQEAAEAAASDIRAVHGVPCDILQADLAETAALRTLVEDAAGLFPGLCLLINNASIFEKNTIADTSLRQFERHINVNAAAPFFLMQAFTTVVQSGHIINILDTKITKPASGYAAYTLSKKLLAESTLMAAAEFAPAFRVNGIAPGFILLPEGADQQYADTLRRSIPLDVQGSETDICSAAWYLETNAFLTGQILYCDGGKHL